MEPIGSRGRSITGAAGWTPPGLEGGGGGAGSGDTTGFYTEGPPTRSGTAHTYDGTSYASLTSMLRSGDVAAGDSVYVDPVNSPYTERIDIDPGDGTPDHITIYSDWDLTYSSDGIATINQEGATFIRPSGQPNGVSISNVIGESGNMGTTSLVGSYNGIHEGVETTEIEVGSSAGISAGDQIVIHEESRPYGLEPSGGASGASHTMEFANVEAVNGNTITIDMPLAMNYPNNSPTDVGPADWTMEDLHMHGLRFQTQAGTETDVYPVYIGSTFNSWFNDLIGEGSQGKPTFFNQAGFYNRFDTIWTNGGTHYGLNNQDGSTRTMATRMMGKDHNRYTVRFGPAGHSTPRGYVNQIAGNSLQRTTGGVHQGGHHVTYENLTATTTRAIVARSWHITLDGFEVTSGSATGPILTFAQQPGYVLIKNGTISGMGGTGSPICGFRMRGLDSNPPYGPERIENVTIENIEIEPYDGNLKSDLGYFETDASSPTQGPLTFRNVTYGGDPLTKSDVTSWSGYDSSIIPDLTVE